MISAAFVTKFLICKIQVIIGNASYNVLQRNSLRYEDMQMSKTVWFVLLLT